MSEKLLIAKYKDGLIKYSEYQEKIHETLYCPFCDPPIRVTHNVKGFFMAWKNAGGHNCGKAREQAKYLDPDWKGRKLTEISRNQEGELEITIDINALVSHGIKNTAGAENNSDDTNDDKERYRITTYKDREEVFRDVVRSVYQMKRILEKNDQQFLRNLKFRTSEGVLSFNDVVFKLTELNPTIVGKSIFVMFRVEKSIIYNGVLYINSLSAKDINFAAKLNYPYDKNPFKKLAGEYAIAYGRLTYSDKSKKYFLTLTNDFQIRKLEEDIGSEFFDDVEFAKYDYKAFIKREANVGNANTNFNEAIENKEKNAVREVINKPTINNNIRVESQADYIHKNTLVNENINKPKPSNISEVKIKQSESIEHRATYKKEDRPIVDLEVNSGSMFSGVKKFFKNLIGK